MISRLWCPPDRRSVSQLWKQKLIAGARTKSDQFGEALLSRTT